MLKSTFTQPGLADEGQRQPIPFVSIIIANYNNAAYIDDALESISKQEFQAWEAIIVDDASTDSSLKVIQPWLKDKRIRLISHLTNQGYSSALLTGLKASSGEILVILDSDDALSPGALSSVSKAHQVHPKAPLILTQMTICDSNLIPLYETKNTFEHNQDPLLWLRGVTHLRTFKRIALSKLDGLNPLYRIAGDMELIFKLEEQGRCSRLESPLLFYRLHGNSLSQPSDRYSRSIWEAAQVIYDAYTRRKRSKSISVPNVDYSIAAAWLFDGFLNLLESGQRLAALGAFWKLIGLIRCDVELLKLVYSNLRAPKSISKRMVFGISRFQSATGNRTSTGIECIPLVHKAGHAIFGGDFNISPGMRSLRVNFDIHINKTSMPTSIAYVELEIYENKMLNRIVASKTLINPDTGFNSPALVCSLSDGMRVEFRVYWHGMVRLKIFSVRVGTEI
jgi:glycosyltransferase involved in cell wall biosynthesis